MANALERSLSPLKPSESGFEDLKAWVRIMGCSSDSWVWVRIMGCSSDSWAWVRIMGCSSDTSGSSDT